MTVSSNSSQTTIPTLYHLHSAQSLRVLWMLEELAEAKGIQYELKTFPRSTKGPHPEVIAVHPLGKMPIMTLKPVDPAMPTPNLQLTPGVLTETRLILQYVAENYSDGLWKPQNEEDTNRDVFFQEFANSTLATKAVLALVFDIIPRMLFFPFKQLLGLLVRPMVGHWCKDIDEIIQLMENSLSDAKPWFSGETMGVADFEMSWGVDICAQNGYIDAKRFPHVMKWHARVKARPAYQRALEKGGAYDLVNFKED